METLGARAAIAPYDCKGQALKPDESPRTTRDPIRQQVLKNGTSEDDLVRALQECQAFIDAGQAIDREKLLKKYPEIQEELYACFEGLELVDEFKSRELVAPHDQAKADSGDTLTPSATLGDFRLQREIGRGGMGVVYEAEQLSVGRRVALKVLPFAAMLDKRQVTRFQNEARAAATLEHPNIVPVYFVGNERGVYYYAMRLIDGKNLAQILADLRNEPDNSVKNSSSNSLLPKSEKHLSHKREISVKELPSTVVSTRQDSTIFASGYNTSKKDYFDSVTKIAIQAAQALEFAHAHGILHRDIKPANIMLDELGDAWVTDFGLARIETDDDVTITGDVVGTLRYMSPEQALAKRAAVDHRSDIYSLGSTLYELLTQCPAFNQDNRAKLLKQIAFEDPKSLMKIDSRIPRDLETIVLKAMQKNPDDRYHTAQQMAEDLQRFVDRQPINARRTPVLRRLSLWRARHPLAVTSITLAIAMLLLLAIGTPFLLMQKAAREQAEQLVSQAQTLADANAARAATQEYYASVNEVRELNLRRPVGWTWDALRKIRNVAGLQADGKDVYQLRSLAANALAATDIQLLQEFGTDIDAGAIAASDDGKWLALGEVRPAPNADVARVFVFKVTRTSENVSLHRTLELPGKSGLGGLMQRVIGGPEGVRSLCFSGRNSRLAVGTRYGQVWEWDLNKDLPPTEVLPAKQDENERVSVLRYSPDDQYLVACINGLDVLRIIAREKSEFPVWDHPRKSEFFAFIEGGRLLFQDAKGVLVSIDDLANPVARQEVTDKPVSSVGQLAANRLGTCGVVSDWSSFGPFLSFLDLQCLRRANRIYIAESTTESALSQLGFGPSNRSVVGVKRSSELLVWDGLSGSQLFNLLNSDATYTKYAIADSTGLMAVSRGRRSELYRWRNEEHTAEATNRSSDATPIIKTFAPGAWPVRSFDLSHDGERIVLVEAHAGRENQVRVRTFTMHNEQEQGRWTLCADTKSGNLLRTRGTDVLYTNGGNIVAACKEVGVPMVLGKDGIQFPAELNRPFITAEARVRHGEIEYEFPEPPLAVKPFSGLALGFCFRIEAASPLQHHLYGQKLRMQAFVDGILSESRELKAEKLLTAGADGWHSLLITDLAKTKQPIRLMISIDSANDGEAISLVPGEAYLMATLGHQAAHYWLGPCATQGNGKIVSAENGTTLTSRPTPLSPPTLTWSDTLNEFATIRTVAASEDSAIFGTRWGHCYLLDAQRRISQLNSVGQSHGGDVQEEVASVAINYRGNFAASGSRDGKLSYFRLDAEDKLTGSQTVQAHPDAITCIAMDRDGHVLASASANSKLRIWKVRNMDLTPWFEMDFVQPIQEMKFSPANENLFILCRGERGIRVLDLHALIQQFKMLGVADSNDNGDSKQAIARLPSSSLGPRSREP